MDRKPSLLFPPSFLLRLRKAPLLPPPGVCAPPLAAVDPYAAAIQSILYSKREKRYYS